MTTQIPKKTKVSKEVLKDEEKMMKNDMEIKLIKENAPIETVNQNRLSRRQRMLSKYQVPECYNLDFGYVILGRTPSHSVDITNMGALPGSLKANCKSLVGTGFIVEFEKVKALPVGQTHIFTVTFDPQGAKLPRGEVCAVLLIQVEDGLTVVQLKLSAVVTVPGCTVSTEKLEFDTIPCGMCQMNTVQLLNSEPVPCQWSISEEVKLKKVNKFLPAYQQKQQPPSVVFEMVPSSGVLSPGDRVNVQIMFTPLEEAIYNKNIVVSIAESDHKVLIAAQGKGEKPQLNFCPPVLQLGPCLPLSTDVEAEITVKNPCSFPIEFYSLELDKQYLEEEEVLRLMRGYDKKNRLLLPPRIPGEGLPRELLDFYQQFSSNQDNDTECHIQKKQIDGFENKIPPTVVELPTFLLSELNREGSYKELGVLHLDPVYRAIACHMGLDLSPDSLAALNRRGIAIIVYGAPKTDISSTAASLAQYYEGALISVDAVVTKAVLNGTSPAGLTARQLFDQAAVEYSTSVGDTFVRINSPGSAVSEVLDRAPSSAGVSSYNGEPTDIETTRVALCWGGDVATLKTVLPEPVLIDILIERFQSSDCHRGIVINGLKSVFTASVPNTLQVVLKALKNRKHIYVVNLTDSYSALLSREKAQRETEEAQQRVAESERLWLQELDEEGCKALPEEMKRLIEQQRMRLDPTRLSKEQVQQRQQGDLKQPKEQDLGLGKEQNHKDSPSKKLIEVNMSLVNEFRAYDESHVQVDHILQHWERLQGVLLVPVPGEDFPGYEESTTKKNPLMGKGKGKKAAPKPPSRLRQIETTEDKLCPANVIPHLAINLKEKDCSALEFLLRNSLPSADEILDDMGLGPCGPPIPPPVIFALVPFPQNRSQREVNECFTFLAPSDHEASERKEEPTVDPVKPKTPGKLRAAKGSPHMSLTSLSAEDQQQLTVKLKRNQSLTNFRWVVPANGEVTLRLWFYSEIPGIFEQTLHFEMAGTQIQWQLLCKGTCAYPSICKDHMTLFANSSKAQHVKDDLQKTYIINPGYFEFGPLLSSKTRDRYKQNKYPGNMETLAICNTSGLEVDVQFSFQNDTQASTYLLEPPAMSLKPEEKQDLMIWAYPTKLGQIKDSIVCKIKDNPEKVVIDVSCWGVRPELELDAKTLSFDKTVIHRRVSRTVSLHNKTALPVSWRLQGIDELGDLFTVPQDQGIVAPHSKFPLNLHFRAQKPLHIKKSLRIEVSDVEKIVGIVQTETVTVTAEAYDVSISIEPDCLHFGVLKVFDEAKTSLRIRNHGKYEIAYKFTLEQTQPKQPQLESLFSIAPQSGKVMPCDKSVTVQITFRPRSEIRIEEQPILLCQIIEPHTGERGETIATLVTRVSVQAVFARYKVTPACEINFDPMALGSKKTHCLTIENNGVFETLFSISNPDLRERSGKKPLNVVNPGGKMNIQKDSNVKQNRITMGVFSVHPCNGVMLPGTQQVVTVDCSADQLGKWDQTLIIDICDRHPSDHPDGIPYRLLAEVYKTGIVSDTSSIFEEHFLCQNSNQLSSEQFADAEGIYVIEENKFIFNKILAGQTAKARIKLTNDTKIPCYLNMAIKYIGPKLEKTPHQGDIFQLSHTTLSIPGQSHRFVEIAFSPLVGTTYHGVFEASMEGASRITPMGKNKVLEFDILGEGILPRVCVVHPALKNSSGDPLLYFHRALIGQRRTQSIVLLNDGNAPTQVQMDMPGKDGVFSLKAAPGNSCSSINTVLLETSSSPGSQPQSAYRAITQLNVNEQVEFEVCFCSKKAQKCFTNVCLEDSHEVITISVFGEAFQEVVSLENIRRPFLETGQIVDDGNYEVVDFGHCHVNVPFEESFTMVNHTKDKVLRFEWPPAGPQVSFSPQVGHLHAGCSKEVTVTFRSSQPISLSSKPVKCRVTRVVFKEPLEQVLDWDDRQKSVHWTSSEKQSSAAPSPSPQPANTKVITADPEPSCSVEDGWHLDLELRINAVCDYVKFSCDTDALNFKDTMLFQTTVQKLRITNKGNVKLEFSWKIEIDHNSAETDESVASSPSGRSSAVTCTSSGVSLLGINPELVPFTVEPSIGTIKPRATQEFIIGFSPLEVSQFEGSLICCIPNVQKKDQLPSITVRGCSSMPFCHFDIEDSDYMSGRRNSAFRHPETRVIEFIAVGVSASSTKCFFVLNPTNQPYSFQWRCEDISGSSFQCLTPSGTLQPKEKAEVHFKYVSAQTDVVESSWSFVIDTVSVPVPFLLVGTTRAPLIYFQQALINFGDLLVGSKTEQSVHLVNAEEMSLQFSVLEPSLQCEDQLSCLVVRPMSGRLGPKERFPLSVSFTPNRQGYVSFKMSLKVERMPEPLVLTVKADCNSMSALVQIEKPSGGLRELSPDHLDSLNFERVGVSEQSAFHFLVSNLAKCDMDVAFDMAGPSNALQHLKVEPTQATVEVGKQLQFSLWFCPLRICNLKDMRLSIKVSNGPMFTIEIKGKGVAPNLDFSFTKHHFGKCFVHSLGMLAPSQTLLIKNKGKRDISLQCQFENTPYLEVGFQPSVLAPGADLRVPITFYPQEARRYQEMLNFTLNSCVTRQVEVIGQGIDLKLDVDDPKHRRIKFRSLAPGNNMKKRVVLVNHSTVSLSFTLHLNFNTPLDPKDLSVTPTGQLTLQAGKSCPVDIQFSPRQHVPKFTVELQAKILGLLHPLLTIRASCQGVQVNLDQNHVALGAVVQHGKTSRKIVMINTGDVDAKFCWKTEKFPPSLRISPTKGIILPSMEVPFEVTFAPLQLSDDSRYENLPCVVEGRSSPLTLTVTGSCIMAPVKETVNFVCPVRRSHTQSLSVQNPTPLHCSIRPVIEGDQWRGAPVIVLEPLENKMFEITYRPLTMTTEARKHQGSLSFFLPDGTGLLYSLQGTAEAPKPEGTIVRELPAKTKHTELLPVHNWLRKQHRFRVVLEIVTPEKPDATLSLTGLEFIDVPASNTRDYKLSFFTYKTGQYDTKVTFRDNTSGEFLFYLITFKASPSQVRSTIELVTNVRQAVSAAVQVENPLATNVVLTAECKGSDISVPLKHTVPGHSQDSVSFDYLPLQSGKTTTRLTLHSHELGHFHYDLVLQALPPPPEKKVRFTASLGNSHSVTVKFTNFSRTRTEFSCKTDCPDFQVDRSVTAAAGSEASVEVCFEPHQQGKVRGQLTLYSPVAGEYVFPLHGVCEPPKPQGMFNISAGRTVSIPFKNVFLEKTGFLYQVNNPSFTVKGAETMDSKRTQNILVSFEAPTGKGTGPWYGRLNITSQRSDAHSTPYSWVFHLFGFRPTSS